MEILCWKQMLFSLFKVEWYFFIYKFSSDFRFQDMPGRGCNQNTNKNYNIFVLETSFFIIYFKICYFSPTKSRIAAAICDFVWMNFLEYCKHIYFYRMTQIALLALVEWLSKYTPQDWKGHV